MPTDSDQRIKTLKTIRGKDITLRYTQDNLEESLINQRQFYDEQGKLVSPITPKLLERQVQPNSPTIARLGGIKPRTITICFGSTANVSGTSIFVVIAPYVPGDVSHSEYEMELLNYVSPSSNLNPPTPLTLNYKGENQV